VLLYHPADGDVREGFTATVEGCNCGYVTQVPEGRELMDAAAEFIYTIALDHDVHEIGNVQVRHEGEFTIVTISAEGRAHNGELSVVEIHEKGDWWK